MRGRSSPPPRLVSAGAHGQSRCHANALSNRITSDDDCRKDQTPSSALGSPETRYSRQPSIEEGSPSLLKRT
ncbi:hypothetical protein CFRS1_v015167 [Colletotrichum fructicola]|nr:hypothetical protein CFRS1_v015167 [Colletotrichum fructicola]